MPPAPPHRVQVIQPDAGLADGQGVGRRRHLPGGHKRLEISDGGDGQIDVIPPPGRHRIPLDPGMAPGLEKAQVVLAHFVQAKLALEYGRANKGIRIAGRITTGIPAPVPGPEEFAAFLALLMMESFLHEEVQSIFVLGEHGTSAFAGRRTRSAKRFSKWPGVLPAIRINQFNLDFSSPL